MKNNFNRRRFIIKTSKGIAGATMLSSIGGSFNLVPRVFASDPDSSDKISKNSCQFGIEAGIPRDAAALDELLKATRNDLGADFVVCHFIPENYGPDRKSYGWVASAKDFNDLAQACKNYNMSYFVNQEVTNYSKDGDFLDEKGNDIMAHPDKTHRWDLTGKALDEATENKQFLGVLYDEPEHGQMRRFANTNGGDNDKSSPKVYPYFAAADGMTLEEAYEASYHSAKAVAENYRRHGVVPMMEDVFPAMFSLFARAGFDIAPKFLKESLDPICAAIAIGAAKEWGTQFCATPDLWGFGGPDWDKGDHFPGHPPEELRASLLYAYWIGAVRIFVENTRGLMERKTENGQTKYELTEYGKIYQVVCKRVCSCTSQTLYLQRYPSRSSYPALR